jgi:hypothetical protein
VAPKNILADKIITVLEFGLIPGRHLGCSPAVLCVAHAMGSPIDFENITPRSWLELESIGIYRNRLEQPSPRLSKQHIIDRADDIIPGLDNPKRVKSTECFETIEINC